MPQYPKIWFLRHGQTEWNKAYRLQGQLNSPLTEQGIADAHAQAALIAPVLRDKPRLVVSPLGRALQTAEIALAGETYETDPRLMEMHAGLWQGRLRQDILQEHPEWQDQWPSALDIYKEADEGEGITAFHGRICAFLEDLTGPTVVVAHGLLGQVLRAEVCGLGLAEAGHLSNDQGCIYVLEDGRETRMDPVG